MANYLAIATVTAAIRQLLSQEISAEIRNIPFTITTSPPDVGVDEPATTRLNIFLYNIMPNIGYANNDLPSYTSTSGELIQRQQLGINLYYLITAYAVNNDDLIAHRFLASAMRILNERPIINKELINSTTDDLALSDDNITGSDLADQIDVVKISHNNLSLDDITRLWSSFFQTHYRLSVSYQATVILLNSKKQQPRPSFPVQERGIFLFPIKQPIVESIQPQIIEFNSSIPMTLNIIGQSLAESTEAVVITTGKPDNIKQVTIDSIGDDRILIKLPTDLQLGINQLQINYNINLDATSLSNSDFIKSAYKGQKKRKVIPYKSSTLSFMLVPRITSASVDTEGNVHLEFEPLVSRDQNVSLLLGDNIFALLANNITIKPKSPTKIDFKLPEEFIAKAAKEKKSAFALRVTVDDMTSILRVGYDFKNPKDIGPILKLKQQHPTG